MNTDETCKKISTILFQDIAFDNDVFAHSRKRELIENLLILLVVEIKMEILKDLNKVITSSK